MARHSPRSSALVTTRAPPRARSYGPAPLTFARDDLHRAGVITAAELLSVPDGRRARVGVVVVVRQHPGTAKGFVFITIEDETGFANAIVTPQRFARDRELIVGTNALVIEGVVQNQRGVVALKADTFTPIAGRRRHLTRLPLNGNFGSG